MLLRKLNSLRLRFALFGAIATILALALSVVALSELFGSHVERRTVRDLSLRLDQLAAALEKDASGLYMVANQVSDPRYHRPLSGLYWQIDLAGQRLRSRSLWDFELNMGPEDQRGRIAKPDQIGTSQQEGPVGEKLLVISKQIELPQRLGASLATLTIAIDRAELDQATEEFTEDLLPYAFLLGFFFLLAGWLQITLGLRPLDQVGRWVATIRSTDKADRDGNFPEEVQPLVNEIDALVSQRQKEVISARNRAGDLAHAFKTPLQALMGEAARLKDQGNEKSSETISTIAIAMKRLVDRELTRTRIAAGDPSASINLSDQVNRVIRVLTHMPDGDQIDWDLAIDPMINIAADGDDIAEALGALLENAAKHAKRRIVVETSSLADSDPALIRLEIADDGPGIPETLRRDLMKRGVKLDESGSGSGLGLAISTEIIEAIGGRLELQANHPSGLKVVVFLPKSAANVQL